jgi:hypothetical protein
MTGRDITELLFDLLERDRDVLEALHTHRLLTTAQIRRLYFAHGQHGRHASQAAASGATMRVLSRLETLGLIARLMRRIGGVRAGSSGIVWQLGAAGERLLRTLHGDDRRRRYLEPSRAFVAHTLDTSDLAVGLHELNRRGAVELLRLEAEPQCWRAFVTAHGVRAWLKPDLFAITASGDYEDHWFIEADRATEHVGAIVRKALIYQRYAATGVHQAEHGLFPMILWVVPDAKRRHTLETALSHERDVQTELFRVLTHSDFVHHIASGSANVTALMPPDNG